MIRSSGRLSRRIIALPLSASAQPHASARRELWGKRNPGGAPAAGKRPYFLCALTTSRLRPFARRRLRTLRPAWVALRLRNPCSLFRLTLLGWYVRFTTTASWERKARQE